MKEARRALYEAIGLSQAQFANPDGDGLDSAALIKAVDEYTRVAQADLLAACGAALTDAKALQKVAFVDPHLEAIIWNLEHAIDKARGASA